MKIQTSGPSYGAQNLYGAQNRQSVSSKTEEDAAMANFDAMFQSGLRGVKADASQATSAEPVNPFGVADAESLTSAFRAWKASRQGAGVGNDYLERIQEQADAFEALIHKASKEGGFADPIAFIKGLSSQERKTLQHIHSLAEPIAPGRLSEEGALNLLLPPNQLKDIDKNGFVMVGEAKTWFFPPVDAPDEVKAAWDKAVEESGQSSLALQGSFLPSPFQENAYLGTNVSSYLDLINERIEGAKFSQKYDFPWQQEDRKKQIAFLTRFLEILGETQG
jgi:hypothetical protein